MHWKKKKQDFTIHRKDHLGLSQFPSQFSICLNYLLNFRSEKSQRLVPVITAFARIILYICCGYGSLARLHTFSFFFVMSFTMNWRNNINILQSVFLFFYPYLIMFPCVCWWQGQKGHLLWISPLNFLLALVFTVSSQDIQGDIKARGLPPHKSPPVCWSGPWLISGEIHPLLSQKTLDQGWRDWLMRGSIYLLCQLNLSAGGYLTTASSPLEGYVTVIMSKYRRRLFRPSSQSWHFCSCHEPIRIWRYAVIDFILITQLVQLTSSLRSKCILHIPVLSNTTPLKLQTSGKEWQSQCLQCFVRNNAVV